MNHDKEDRVSIIIGTDGLIFLKDMFIFIKDVLGVSKSTLGTKRASNHFIMIPK